MGAIVSPFSWDIWVMHVVMMVFGGTTILFMEATRGLLTSTPPSPPEADAHDDSSDGGKEGGELSVDGVLVTMFSALTHFLWNGPKHDPQTIGGKVAIFALSFHTVIFTAYYTASLTGILSTSHKEPVVVLSFSSIKRSPLSTITGKLCVLQSAQVRAQGAGGIRQVGGGGLEAGAGGGLT
jgi:hypothetical protein